MKDVDEELLKSYARRASELAGYPVNDDRAVYLAFKDQEKKPAGRTPNPRNRIEDLVNSIIEHFPDRRAWLLDILKTGNPVPVIDILKKDDELTYVNLRGIKASLIKDLDERGLACLQVEKTVINHNLCYVLRLDVNALEKILS